MQALYTFLFSSRLMGMLLFIFAFAVGGATLIENSYDTVTAKVLVYNARWFEVVLLLLVINFIGNIGKYRLFQKKKISSLVFHFAFIVVILGAGVTRYTGFEGVMPIKEGETSNTMFSAEAYLQIYIRDQAQEKQYTYDNLLRLTTITDNSFSVPIEFPGKDKIEVSYKRFIKNAIVELQEDVDGGEDVLEIMLAGRQKLQLKNGEVRDFEGLTFAYNNNARKDAIQFIGNGDDLQIYSPVDILSRNMLALSVEDRSKSTSELGFDTLKRDSVHQIGLRYLLFTGGNQIMVNKFYESAKSIISQAEEEKKGQDVLVINLNYQGEDIEIPLFGGQGYSPDYVMHQQGDLLFKFGYGSREIKIPFSIRLDDFVLEKYPGGVSPSSFLSHVTLEDDRVDLEEPHTIFMNNVMDYGGYRFFQSSYDPKDELTTILSVNHDFWGTWITYVGYIFLALGFLLALFNPNGRFRDLLKKVIKMHKKDVGKALIVLLMLASFTGYSQIEVVSQEAADKFGRVFVLSNDRFQPSHSLAYDIFHKVSKKDKFEFDSVGNVDAMQLYMDIPLNPMYWAQQELIYIRGNTGVRELLGINGAYASVNDFMADSITWNIKPELIEKFKESNAKKPIEQNGFDKELLKVNERLNILLMTFYGQMYVIVPVEGSLTNNWVSVIDSAAYLPVGDHVEGVELSYALQFKAYMIYLDSAKTNGNDSIPEKILNNLIQQQREWDVDDLLPSESMVELEIYYNKTNIFKTLERAYSILALLLLVLTIIQVLKEKASKVLNAVIWLLVAVVAVCFAYHSFGLGLRWYLTGHAPWSNGYEALVFISWGSLLIGFVFMKYTKLILAATVLIAFLILMTAGHSSFDPQLTSLQPVLKSYWLIIHVACITLSYSFFGVGFILGLINLFFYLLKNKSNERRISRSVLLLTHINEMVIIIGIVLATVGTFLGGVWANESWGRYWGWDAKETWALVIVLVYAIVLHLRFMPGKAKGKLTFNLASIFAFSTVLMTFVGVNYYLSKGLHSYARGETPAFPMWVWYTIFVLIALSFLAIRKEAKSKALKA